MKRDDLQGIRGFAIIAVLGFHFFPFLFPNGYIGVDMFFVLSGFLMTMIFGSKAIDRDSTKLFFYRRAKRILPLYLLIILLGCISIFIVFPSTFISMNMTSAWNSIFLYHNMVEHSDENFYFKMLNQADDIFTHTWSLCVEMQFYILVPFIFFLHSYCEDFVTSSCFFGFSICFSLGNHLFLNEKTAFNNVICRIWQFLIGSVSFYISENLMSLDTVPSNDYKMLLCEEENEENEQEVNENTKYEREHNNLSRFPYSVMLWFSICLLCFCVFVDYKINTKLLRIVCTALTGTLITAGTLININPMKHRILVYIGDISYSLYLVHWPVYVFVKQFYPNDWKIYIFAISFSLIVSMIINETFEKTYLKLGKRSILFMIILFYISIITIIYNQERMKTHIDRVRYSDEQNIIKSVNSFENVTLKQAIALNSNWAKNEYQLLVIPNCFPNKTEHGYCEFENNSLTGNLDVFMVGNSFTPNLAELVYKTFGKHARNMSKYSYSYCEVLTVASEKRCRKAYQTYLDQTFLKIPDVLFILDRPTKLDSPLSGNISVDSVFVEALASLRKYENLVKKKIYLLDPITPPEGNILTMLASALEKKKNVTQSLFKVDFSYQNGHRRLVELVRRCNKCEMIDISHILYNGIATKTFDEKTKLGYYHDGKHMTPFGKKLILPEFKRISDSYS